MKCPIHAQQRGNTDVKKKEISESTRMRSRTLETLETLAAARLDGLETNFWFLLVLHNQENGSCVRDMVLK